jgi:predicted Rdx family selenoprotein
MAGVALPWLAATVALGGDDGGVAVDLFRRVVEPTLRDECGRCHGASRQRGGLRLDSRAALLSGGGRGPALRPGDPDGSLLVRALRHDDEELAMPPGGAVDPEVVAAFTAWITADAPWPSHAPTTAHAAAHDAEWAFAPIADPPPPQVDAATVPAGFLRDPLDAFIAARLVDAGLAPSPPSDARTLIRRASLVATGLPPTPEEVADFVAASAPSSDAADAAYERLIDRLLASPRHAEHAALDWLDVVRFAETHGFEMNQPRANAWPYRDFVIEAFHDDLPFRDFVRLQLAGDLLGEDRATGFLVAGAWDEVKSPDPELTAMQRDDELHSLVATTGAAFLGLTVGCAKCHDHKFDPIEQRDYFAMRACLAGVQFGARPWRSRAGSSEPPGRDAVDPRRNEERFPPVIASRVRFVVARTNGGEPCLDELEVLAAGAPPSDAGGTRINVALAALGAVASASSAYPGDPQHQVAHLNDGRHGNGRSAITAEPGGWFEVALARPTLIDSVVWGRDREGVFSDRLAVDYRIEVLVDGLGWRTVATSADRRPLRPLPSLFAGRFDPAPPPTRRLERGNPLAPCEEVAPGGLAAIALPLAVPPDAGEPQRRLALADWIADPRHPLPSRVVANRLWQWVFGRGLVGTPGDLGAMGDRPSHPELLDALARDFLACGGRRKPLLRRLLLSGTFRQSSAPRAEPLAVDAEARLLWRFPPRRLAAEAIRDSMLAVAGLLDPRTGGPGVSAFAPNDNYVRLYEGKREFGPGDFRRSIQLLRVRMHPDPTFGVFDQPDQGTPCPKRAQSTTALQALALAHAPFVLEVARRFAGRLEAERPGDRDAQLIRGFARAFQRAPHAEELAAARAVATTHGLGVAARGLLNASEASWIE